MARGDTSGDTRGVSAKGGIGDSSLAEAAPAAPGWARSILPAPTLACRQWSHALSRRCREPARVAGFIQPASQLHHIVMPVDVGFQLETRELGSGRWRHYEVRPGELCVLGAGAEPNELCWRALGGARSFDVVELYIDPSALQGAGATTARTPEPRSLEQQWRVLRDPLLTELLRSVCDELDRPDSAEDSFGDLAITLFGLQLGRAHSVTEVSPKLRRSGLAPFALKRVREYVAAHLTRPIRLQQLAAVAGLSPFHFARAFKASTGLSPHAYVTHCRIVESKRLLSGSTLSIREIARRTGFGGTAQLSTRFRACTGTTPSGFRRGSGP